MKSIGQCGNSTIVQPTSSGPGGRFQDGTPGQESTSATQLIAEYMNSQLEEFANVLQDGIGEEFSESDDTQLLRAINGLVGDILKSANEWAKGQRYVQTALAINAGAVVWNMEANPHAVLVLTANVTSFTVSNFKAGATYELTVLQDATGSRTMVWPASIRWPGGTAVEVTADANSEDLINFSVRDNAGAPVLRGYAGQDFKVVA